MKLKEILKAIHAIIILAILILAAVWVANIIFSISAAETDDKQTSVYVTANRLNGRAMPRKKSHIEALFDYGDKLTATGKWSRDHKWIQVEGGEGGTVWVDIRYVSEIKQPVIISTNISKLKIRKNPFNGKITGYLKYGKELEIDQIILGWGHCSKGWIDLEYCYFIEE